MADGRQRRAPRTAALAFEAVIFDMDGVVTRTAGLHAAAWKELFDDFLRARADASGAAFEPFDPRADYLAYVDGRPRHEGVRTFLAARGIDLPEGRPDDPPHEQTLHALGARKDGLFEQRLRREGVQRFDSTLELIGALHARGVKIGVVTSSRHGREVLGAAGVAQVFDARVDGLDAEVLGLRGKPHPDAFHQCAEMLRAAPARTVVVEDAVSGVEAGRRGGFGLVVGVDRGGNRRALARHGADLVVTDLAELGIGDLHGHVRAKQGDVAWRIEQEGLDPAREHDMLSLFTVANGYLGVRGGLDTPLPGTHNDLFVAGVYDRKRPERPYSEHEFLGLGRGDYPYSELVSAPFPFRIALRVDGTALELTGDTWREHRRILDLHQGVLCGEVRFELDAGRRAVVRTRRCACAVDPHLLLQEVTVRIEGGAGTVELDAHLNGRGGERDVADHPHLVRLDPGPGELGIDVDRLVTRASGIEIVLAARTTRVDGERDETRWEVAAADGETLTFRRVISVWSSRDVDDPSRAAREQVGGFDWAGFDALLAEHRVAWADVWRRADVRVADSRATEQALRFHVYHLLSAAGRDPRVSVGARALTGRAYEGHVFWDVEIFMLPLYVHTAPEVARSLLLYRHHTLDGARRRARELGYRGACFAWESTVTGDDVTPSTIRLRTTGKEIPIFTGTEQIHVTADIAYGIWRYWDATRDAGFLRDAGAEVLFESARFWASRCVRAGSRYHLRGVVGPDEYHHGVSDNAYTNWMARFNLERAVWAAGWLRREAPGAWERLRERLDLAGDETEQWSAVARELHVPGPREDGVIEQFEGFFDLEEYALPKAERFKAPVSRLFDWERINRLQLIKQADVLMIPFLFPDAFSPEVLAANYRYYEPRTDHGSSLSPPVHAALAARLGHREEAERYWRESLWLDLSNRMSNSALGVHPACMGATWQALVHGFLGVRFTDAGPVPDPGAGARLPERWGGVELKLAWRGRFHAVEVTR